jgi:hypothetical protein
MFKDAYGRPMRLMPLGYQAPLGSQAFHNQACGYQAFHNQAFYNQAFHNQACGYQAFYNQAFYNPAPPQPAPPQPVPPQPAPPQPAPPQPAPPQPVPQDRVLTKAQRIAIEKNQPDLLSLVSPPRQFNDDQGSTLLCAIAAKPFGSFDVAKSLDSEIFPIKIAPDDLADAFSLVKRLSLPPKWTYLLFSYGAPYEQCEHKMFVWTMGNSQDFVKARMLKQWLAFGSGCDQRKKAHLAAYVIMQSSKQSKFWDGLLDWLLKQKEGSADSQRWAVLDWMNAWKQRKQKMDEPTIVSVLCNYFGAGDVSDLQRSIAFEQKLSDQRIWQSPGR